jgi:hypothetical protein
VIGLSAAWKWFLGTAVGRWIAGIGLTVVVAAGLLYVAFRKGKHAQADTDKAKDAEAAQRAAQEAAATLQRSADAVRQTHDEVSKMPDAGTQRVGDAAPDSAAGWLREHATRPQRPDA